MIATPLGIAQEIFSYQLQVNVFSKDVHVPFVIDLCEYPLLAIYVLVVTFQNKFGPIKASVL